jgi:hypothetical protein
MPKNPSRRSRNAIVTLAMMAVLSGVALQPQASLAAGALALALPPDVAASGFSYGYSISYPDAAQADANAVQTCQNSTKDPNLQSLCKINQDFSDQCVAVAMDPQNGTPGVGWAIAADSTTAQSTAIAACQNTAGASRQSFCKVDHFGCDGTAK